MGFRTEVDLFESGKIAVLKIELFYIISPEAEQLQAGELALL